MMTLLALRLGRHLRRGTKPLVQHSGGRIVVQETKNDDNEGLQELQARKYLQLSSHVCEDVPGHLKDLR